MSLLEVLISIAILSVGLLGVAAVIPVARFEMVEAAKADRGSACGQSELCDIKVRGILNPHQWQSFNTNPSRGSLGTLMTIGQNEPNWGGGVFKHTHRGFEFGESYAVDPLLVGDAKNSGGNQIRLAVADFPYNPSNPGTRVIPATSPPSTDISRCTRMCRVTWTGVPLDAQLVLPQQVFKWHDDLLFDIPDDETQRAQQYLIRDSFNNPLKPEFQGNYSWLVTVTPSPEHIDFVHPGDSRAYTFTESSPLYTVSVAVFYKRDMTLPTAGAFGGDEPPGERQVRLEFLGTGLGGGDVRLSVLPGEGPEYLDIKENEWLLVSGGYTRVCEYYDELTGMTRPYLLPVGVHKWYRIVAMSEIVIEDKNGNGVLDAFEDSNANGVLDPPYREVTLAGPDWNPAWTPDWNGDGATDVFAALFKGVVGVYSTTMEL